MNASDVRELHNLPKNVYLQYIKLFPVTQTEQVKNYTTLLLTLVAIIVFSLFAISPTINTIVELRKTLADSQFADNALEEKLAALESLQNQYDSLDDRIERVSATIPTSPEVPLLLAKVQTLARDAGLSIVKLETLQVELTKSGAVGSEPDSFVFSITVSGSYDQVRQFLDSLPRLDRLVSVDAITLNRSLSTSGQVTGTIRARAYFHPEAL